MLPLDKTHINEDFDIEHELAFDAIKSSTDPKI